MLHTDPYDSRLFFQGEGKPPLDKVDLSYKFQDTSLFHTKNNRNINLSFI